MSWRATAWAAKQRTGLPGAKLTLLALASYANGEHVAWPSQETLAANTEQSADSVQRHIKLLESAGLISIERRPGKRGQWPSLVYRLHVTEPHGAARDHAAVCGTAPSRKYTPHRAANDPSTVPQALRHEPSLEEPSSERLEPQGVNKGEEEPSPDSVTNYVRQREQDDQRLAEQRKQRPTLEQIKQRLGPTYGLKPM